VKLKTQTQHYHSTHAALPFNTHMRVKARALSPRGKQGHAKAAEARARKSRENTERTRDADEIHHMLPTQARTASAARRESPAAIQSASFARCRVLYDRVGRGSQSRERRSSSREGALNPSGGGASTRQPGLCGCMQWRGSGRARCGLRGTSQMYVIHLTRRRSGCSRRRIRPPCR